MFGKINSTTDTIEFKHWNEQVWEQWAVKIDEASVEILSTGKRNMTNSYDFRAVADNLSINVIFHKSTTMFPLNVDGTMFDPSSGKCNLSQAFYFENMGENNYRLHIPHNTCTPSEVQINGSIYFEGKKTGQIECLVIPLKYLNSNHIFLAFCTSICFSSHHRCVTHLYGLTLFSR
ncbi:MAG: hypothetical protein ABI402_14255 [Ferruginibacter sp.]